MRISCFENREGLYATCAGVDVFGVNTDRMDSVSTCCRGVAVAVITGVRGAISNPAGCPAGINRSISAVAIVVTGVVVTGAATEVHSCSDILGVVHVISDSRSVTSGTVEVVSRASGAIDRCCVIDCRESTAAVSIMPPTANRRDSQTTATVTVGALESTGSPLITCRRTVTAVGTGVAPASLCFARSTDFSSKINIGL